MEFAFTEEQQAVAEAATGVFAGRATSERVAEVEATDDRFDAALWAELARANLLGLAVGPEHGGAGLGLTEVCLVLEQQGRTVAPVPLWATLVLGALTLERVADESVKAAWLPGVVSGDVRLTAAVAEVAASRARRPSVEARTDGGGWRLHGVARAVPQAHLAARVLVPARADRGATILALVDPAGPGARLERAFTTDRQVHPHLELDGAPVAAADVVAGPERGDEAVAALLDLARTGLCAVALGVAEEAVRRAAAHLNERTQFGRPLASFQAAMLRAADAYIDTEAMRVTLWQAAWRLDAGRPAAEAVAVAMWWASEAGQRVVHAVQHLHGGVGADVSYPIHRYFLWNKQIELMLGPPSAELARLGALIAARAGAGAPAGAVS